MLAVIKCIRLNGCAGGVLAPVSFDNVLIILYYGDKLVRNHIRRVDSDDHSHRYHHGKYLPQKHDSYSITPRLPMATRMSERFWMFSSGHGLASNDVYPFQALHADDWTFSCHLYMPLMAR